MNTASDNDHRIIDATSIALDGSIGRDDDVQRLRHQIEQGNTSPGKDKLQVACEIAVAFIRWAQDLKPEYQEQKERIRKIKSATAEGCLAAAMGRPLHSIAETRHKPRSYEGDAWEAGWEYINGSAEWQDKNAG